MFPPNDVRGSRWRMRSFSGKFIEAFAAQPFRKFGRNGFVVEIGESDVRVAAQPGVGQQQDLAISAVTIDDAAEGLRHLDRGLPDRAR